VLIWGFLISSLPWLCACHKFQYIWSCHWPDVWFTNSSPTWSCLWPDVWFTNSSPPWLCLRPNVCKFQFILIMTVTRCAIHRFQASLNMIYISINTVKWCDNNFGKSTSYSLTSMAKITSHNGVSSYKLLHYLQLSVHLDYVCGKLSMLAISRSSWSCLWPAGLF
jgi:hypothetical protein